MADRIYGPILGAGTQVREREPQRNIVQAQLGATVMVGVLERGAEDIDDEIIVCPSNKSRARKIGGYLDPADFNASSFASLEAPMHGDHFFTHSEGAGMLCYVRATPKTNDATNDDRPVKSTLTVFDRQDIPAQIGTLTAKNGGRWAGQRRHMLGKITGTPATDFPLTNQVQLDFTGLTKADMHRDEWKGATLDLHGLSTTYTVTSNTSAGLLTLEPSDTVDDDWTAAGPPTDYEVSIHRDNLNTRAQEKRMSVKFTDGGLDPDLYFGMIIYVDGDALLTYENLSMDNTSPYYWQNVVNDDPNNDLVTVADSYSGTRTVAAARPSNRTGLSKTLTATVLTVDDPTISNINSPVGAWVPTISAITYGASVVPQTLTVTADGAGNLTVATDLGNRTYSGTVGAPLATDKDMIGFTIAAGAGSETAGDTFDIVVKVFYDDELIGGKVFPDTSDIDVYTIIDNTATTVTVTATADMTDATGGALSGGENYRVEYPQRFGGGYDGYIAGMVTGDYETIFDPATTPLRRLKRMNWGLVKMSIPGIAKPSAALALQKKAHQLALSFNWQYRVEIPDEYLTEESALNWVNNSLGRTDGDMMITFYPSFMHIRDPLATSGADAVLQEVSVTGMQLGREARFAREYQGYHKAGAGIDATLPLVLKSEVLGTADNPIQMNEELLNPSGLNPYRWSSGGANIVAWGDRTLDKTSQMKWKHKREQLSHYENVLLENFDWAIFKINDPIADADVLAALHEYFAGEFRSRAIRGDQFIGGSNPAAIIKMDGENNTDATRGQGDQNVDISLRLADVVERLKISIGAMGITESR